MSLGPGTRIGPYEAVSAGGSRRSPTSDTSLRCDVGTEVRAIRKPPVKPLPPHRRSDIMPLETDRKPRPLLHSPANEAWAEISPDGKWLAYGSDWSGRFEVYVQPFPGPGPREPISFNGADSRLWSRDGRELFFLTYGDTPGVVQVNAVDVTVGSSFASGKPRPLFSGRFGRTGGPTAYDVRETAAGF